MAFKCINEVDEKITATVCGSFRRGIMPKRLRYNVWDCIIINMQSAMWYIIYFLPVIIIHQIVCFDNSTGAESSGDIDILICHPAFSTNSKAKVKYYK